ncbi:MAG: double-stranded DNA-binding protein [Candidatus Brockarchaeota archaeon]|nr:double-stranded DNA-binding protein [Candidatus Brockarchaeota archaeon]
MSEDDIELNLLRMKRLRQLQEKARSKETGPPPEKVEEDPRRTLSKLLDGKAAEILEVASYQFPSETEAVVKMLANLAKRGAIKETIDGPTLYHLFLRIGIPVKLKTRIVYYEDGKVKSLEEKLKER